MESRFFKLKVFGRLRIIEMREDKCRFLFQKKWLYYDCSEIGDIISKCIEEVT